MYKANFWQDHQTQTLHSLFTANPLPEWQKLTLIRQQEDSTVSGPVRRRGVDRQKTSSPRAVMAYLWRLPSWEINVLHGGRTGRKQVCPGEPTSRWAVIGLFALYGCDVSFFLQSTSRKAGKCGSHLAHRVYLNA